jgi:hypothetical protein
MHVALRGTPRLSQDMMTANAPQSLAGAGVGVRAPVRITHLRSVGQRDRHEPICVPSGSVIAMN